MHYYLRLALALTCISLTDCRVHSADADRSEAKHKPYSQTHDVIELYELRELPDAEFNIQICDTTGKKWFRNHTPGLTSRQCSIDTAVTTMHSNRSVAILLPLLPEHQDDFNLWTRTRIGRTIGVFIEGNLFYHTTIATSIRTMIGVEGFGDLKSARDVIEAMRRD